MVTDVPTVPDVGFKLVMLGADEVTVKLTPLLMIFCRTAAARRPRDNHIPRRRSARHWHDNAGRTPASRRPHRSVEGDRARSLRRAEVRPRNRHRGTYRADVGFRLVMLGGGGVTTKFIPLLATPPTVTTTFLA